MKSTVELDIDARQTEVSELFANPLNNPRWMDDLERIEPISGELGRPGSVYRMVPREGGLGGMEFVATVVKRELPDEVRLALQSSRVSMQATDTFQRLSDGKTRMISEEVFTFKGLFSKVFGLMARGRIKAAHRRHIEAFKRFAETTTASPLRAVR